MAAKWFGKLFTFALKETSDSGKVCRIFQSCGSYQIFLIVVLSVQSSPCRRRRHGQMLLRLFTHFGEVISRRDNILDVILFNLCTCTY